jgi:putative FmdB family regulatory protein
MPVYVYQCDTCGLTFERRQRMSDVPLVDCPECDGHVHRIIQPVGVVFKGSGFYVTDNRSRSSTALPGKKETDTPKKEETSDTKSDSADTSKATSD